MNEKKRIDYTFKKKVLDSGLPRLLRQASLKDFHMSNYIEEGIITNDIKKDVLEGKEDNIKYLDSIYFNYWLEGRVEEFNEALKINDAHYHRIKRLNKRVGAMLEDGQCLFLTLTFNDNCLNETTPHDRRVAVTRYLKQYQTKYIANIDYGKTNHREHYHALILIDKVNNETWKKYGNINFKKVRYQNGKSPSKILAKYIAKLSNHAIKETTKRSTLIYSR